MIVSYEEKVKERFLKNYFFLRENTPGLLKKAEAEGHGDWRVIVGADGSLNAVFGGQLLYPFNPRKLARQQVEDLMRNPKRIVIPSFPMSSEGKLIHSKYYSRISRLHRSLKISSFIYDGKNIPVMIVFGMGFGYHVIELIRRFNIQHMIVIEPVSALFRLSLYAVDWEEIFNYFKREGRSFNVIIGDEEEQLKEEINRKFSFISPAFTSYIFIFEHFSAPIFNRIKEWIVTEFVETPLLWGFFDDEIWSLKHTIGNLRNGVPIFYGDRPVESDVPVFVVGSGPSLDLTLETIKRFSNRAVVVSCGTALGALYRAGIKPDVHVEIERTEIVFKTLSELDRSFLKDIPIVGMNTLYPKVFKLGKRGYMFLKPNDTGSALLPPDIPRLFNSNPTVTAGAISLMASAGFRRFYLFGVDLGSRTESEHHSRLSGYYSEKSILKSFSPNYDRILPGNFGGTVLSNLLFYYTKIAVEINIRRFNLEVYNTSDGAKIEGAHPLPAEEITLPDRSGKSDAIRGFFTNFKSTYRKDVSIDRICSELEEDFDLYLREFLPRLSAPSEDTGDIIQLFSDMHFYLLALGMRRKKSGEPVLKNLIGSSLYQLQKLIISSAFAITSPEERHNYLREAYRALGDFLKEARAELSRAAG